VITRYFAAGAGYEFRFSLSRLSHPFLRASLDVVAVWVRAAPIDDGVDDGQRRGTLMARF